MIVEECFLRCVESLEQVKAHEALTFTRRVGAVRANPERRQGRVESR